MNLTTLVDYCNQYLSVNEFKDYCPNGLQVEGKSEVTKIICGVTACEALIDRAIALKVDAILVHHGFFWKNEPAPIVGLKGRKIKKLIQNDISLLAYHLPLDAHPVVGNNAQLNHFFKTKIQGSFYNYQGQDIALFGDLKKPLDINSLVQQLNIDLQREALLLKGDDRKIKRIAWCSGGAQGGFEEAIVNGADVYVSGEVSESTFHLAQESGVHYVAAGHHATERYGVQALAQHLSEQFNLEYKFVEINNPV